MSATNDMGMGGEADAGASATPPAAPEKNVIKLSPELFPEGMSPKAGDTLVLGEPDEDGMITATYQPVKNAKGDEMEDQAWQDGLRKHMSATAPEEGAA